MAFLSEDRELLQMELVGMEEGFSVPHIFGYVLSVSLKDFKLKNNFLGSDQWWVLLLLRFWGLFIIYILWRRGLMCKN